MIEELKTLESLNSQKVKSKNSKKNINYFNEIIFEIDRISQLIQVKMNKTDISLIDKIFSKIKLLLRELDVYQNNKFLKIYEPILIHHEKEIRKRIGNEFVLRSNIILLENKIKILQKKEEEYEHLKKLTNVSVENGQFFFTDKKENEIIILKTENSNLKKVILKYEKELEKKMKREIELENSKNNLEKKLKTITYNKLTNHIHSYSNSHLSSLLNDLNYSNIIPANKIPNRININKNNNKKLEYLSTSLNDSKSNFYKLITSENKSPNKLALTISYSNRPTIQNEITLYNPHKRMKSEFSSIENDFNENFLKKRVSPVRRAVENFNNNKMRNKFQSELNYSQTLNSLSKIPRINSKKNNNSKKKERINGRNSSIKSNNSLVTNFLIYKNANINNTLNSNGNMNKDKSIMNYYKVKRNISRNTGNKKSRNGSMIRSFKPPIRKLKK